MIRRLFALLCCWVPALAAAAAPEKTVDAFHRALLQGHAAQAEALLHPEAVIYEQGGAERSRAEYSAAHLAADIAFSKATERKVLKRQVRISGNTAWVLSEAQTSGEYQGKPVNQGGVETMILSLENGTWRIAHIHWSGK